jgi:hypothetical protein
VRWGGAWGSTTYRPGCGRVFTGPRKRGYGNIRTESGVEGYKRRTPQSTKRGGGNRGQEARPTSHRESTLRPTPSSFRPAPQSNQVRQCPPGQPGPLSPKGHVEAQVRERRRPVRHAARHRAAAKGAVRRLCHTACTARVRKSGARWRSYGMVTIGKTVEVEVDGRQPGLAWPWLH